MRAVDQGSPGAAGALEPKPLYEGESHGFDGMPGERPSVVLEDLTVSIVTVVGVSEIELMLYSIHGKTFQRRSHQVRVRRSVSLFSQVR